MDSGRSGLGRPRFAFSDSALADAPADALPFDGRDDLREAIARSVGPKGR